MSILIYEVLKLIRGTRAVQMALGGGVLARSCTVALGHLETLNWLIRNMPVHRLRRDRAVFSPNPPCARAFGRAPFSGTFAKPSRRRVD